MSAYERRQMDRRDRLLELADRMQAASDTAYNRARDMASVIPMGQPILVGHHSEKRDRNYRARIWRTQDRCLELQRKADYFRQKAAGVGKGGISSDDPEAVEKLKAELSECERLQEVMKAGNKIVRSKLSDNDKVSALVKIGLSERRAWEALKPDFCGRVGFPDYALQNNNANMRRIRQRIEQLESRPTEDKETERNGVIVREDATEGRIMLLFPNKPADEVRAILKQCGFKWSPSRGGWVRFLNDAGRAAATYALNRIEALTLKEYDCGN